MALSVVEVDVVVIGAGIAGAAVAWRLAPRVRVALVETEASAGTHATGRSAAMLNETSGQPVVCRLASLSRPFLAAPPAGFTDHPLLSPRGLLWVGRAGTGPLLADLVAKAPHAATAIDIDQARHLVPTLCSETAAGGAVYEPGAVTIDVAALLAGYLRGVRAFGGSIHLTSEAMGLTHTSSGWLVRAGDQELACSVVVNAAGAWADVVAARAGVDPVGLEPRRRTAALAVAPASVCDWPMVMDVAGGWYAEPEAGGLLISPADETPTRPGDARADEIDVALGLERVSHALGLELRSVRRAWAGLRTFASDGIPVVGPDPDEPSFVWLAGQGGAGIKMAPALAELVAGVVLNDQAVGPELSPARLRSR